MNDKPFFPVSRGKQSVETGKTKKPTSKEDKGAALFWSVFQNFGYEIEQLQERDKKLSEKVFALERRVAVLEGRMNRGSVGEVEEKRINMICILCDHEFSLPEGEVTSVDFVGTCPECRGQAIPMLEEDPYQAVYTVKAVSKMLELHPDTVCAAARKYGLGKGGGKPGVARTFSRMDVEQMRKLHPCKRRGKA